MPDHELLAKLEAKNARLIALLKSPGIGHPAEAD
jgi:hypothetical protein